MVGEHALSYMEKYFVVVKPTKVISVIHLIKKVVDTFLVPESNTSVWYRNYPALTVTR